MDDHQIARDIAEKVMGLELREYYSDDDGIVHKGWFVKKLCATIIYDELPDYPNDPAAVFGPEGVVERMREGGFSLSLNYFGNGEALVSYRRDGDEKWSTRILQKPLTRAVCLAALAAVEGNDE
jgi:hypothetical protein